MNSQALKLSELTAFIRRVFALNLPEPVWVTAELAQATISRGHCWLTLIEQAEDGAEVIAQLEAVAWGNALQKIRRERGRRLVDGVLTAGMSVRLRVTASFHERFGLRLVVEDVDTTHTIGLLEQQRQATLEALARDGLLTRNASLTLPLLPNRLAIVSSDTAAGLVDFRRQLSENLYGYVFKSDLYPAAMQGARTGEEIIRRLRQIERRRDEYDAVIIVRGGGGKMDLAAFDGEALCRAVASTPLPVLVGIGHEVDETLLDRVAHRSLKTPTAVAVYLIERLLEAEGRALQLGRSIGKEVASQIQGQLLGLGTYERDLALLPGRSLDAARLQLDHYEDLLNALRPETTLARGYALVSQKGRLLTDPKQVQAGKIRLQLKQGTLDLTTEAN